MYRIAVLITFALLQSGFSASAERIKRKRPTKIEAARIASDQAMSDGTLRKGDVVSTDRGFFQFRGWRQTVVAISCRFQTRYPYPTRILAVLAEPQASKLVPRKPPRLQPYAPPARLALVNFRLSGLDRQF
jgi:hypothetical protein